MLGDPGLDHSELANGSLTLIKESLGIVAHQKRGLNGSHNLDQFVLDKLVGEQALSKLLPAGQVLDHIVIDSESAAGGVPGYSESALGKKLGHRLEAVDSGELSVCRDDNLLEVQLHVGDCPHGHLVLDLVSLDAWGVEVKDEALNLVVLHILGKDSDNILRVSESEFLPC